MIILLFIIATSLIHGVEVGNPSHPRFFKKGIFTKKNYFKFQAGYLYSNIYKTKYEDEIITETSKDSFFNLKMDSAILSFNFKNRLDIYGILGNSSFNIDREIKTDKSFSWGTGLKLLFFHKKKFFLAVDGKYFKTKQKLNNFFINKKIFTIEFSRFGFLYEELQGSIAISYKISPFFPYIGASYLYSTITPYPGNKGLIRYPYPNQDIIDDFICSKIKNKKNFGLVIGAAINNKNGISINLESRFFDQNAINVSGEIRF
ncbi:MAG: hypothetical protein AMS24_00475 [Chlamydiae bacterium SM23_39]|nr:MAG: hypothetical protein AMS24_00475 [Chlamydiae bacterium SM23_39]